MVRHSQRDVPCLLRGWLAPRINEEGTLRGRLEPSSKKRKVWGFSGGVTGTGAVCCSTVVRTGYIGFSEGMGTGETCFAVGMGTGLDTAATVLGRGTEEWAASEAWEPEEFASIRPVVPPTPQHVDEYRRIPKMPVCLPIPDANHLWRTTVSKSPQSDL